MEWYWWILIVVGVVALAWIKVKVGGAFLRSMQERKAAAERRLEEDG
jgi:hypothetical protein